MKALPLLLLAVWGNLSSGSGAEFRCAHSPSTWCSSVEAAVQCGVLQQCLEANYTQSRQTADPVKIELYYESLCPGCRNFITSMLYPTSVLLGDIMDLTLVPYGNAQESFDGDKYIFKCQHGVDECVGNMIEACLLNLTNSDPFLPIFCMEASNDPVKAAQLCVDLFSPQLGWERLMKCVNGDLGNQIMHQNALKTQALKPPHNYVPWIVINGVHTEDLQDKAFDALVPLVCDMYKGEKPAICGGKGRRFKSYSHK
ncbi:gamma-interferon-inducible lysosomal thiol reductase-like [Eucyclogobius newberryi]|uniref:gamma-interferon-inducible lysosomal thiol reductase-like n=1 Tax=Eucyclogobius newberryi TaxID=166745 RepID=UPI003B5B29EB